MRNKSQKTKTTKEIYANSREGALDIACFILGGGDLVRGKSVCGHETIYVLKGKDKSDGYIKAYDDYLEIVYADDNSCFVLFQQSYEENIWQLSHRICDLMDEINKLKIQINDMKRN